VPLTTRNELALQNPSTRGSISESGRVEMVRQVHLYGLYEYCCANSYDRSSTLCYTDGMASYYGTCYSGRLVHVHS